MMIPLYPPKRCLFGGNTVTHISNFKKVILKSANTLSNYQNIIFTIQFCFIRTFTDVTISCETVSKV